MAEINITEVLIGCQGSGKSWHGMQRAAELAASYDCPLVIHDSGSASIRKRKNPYHNADWKLYRDPIPPKGIRLFPPDIYIVNTAHAEDALFYADAVKGRGNVVVLIDEVTAAKHIHPSGIQDPWRTRIAQRRALRTGLIFCMQSPTMASRFMTATATAVKVFRLQHPDDLKVLNNFRFDNVDIEQVPTLGRGEYIEVNQGFGSDSVERRQNHKSDGTFDSGYYIVDDDENE